MSSRRWQLGASSALLGLLFVPACIRWNPEVEISPVYGEYDGGSGYDAGSDCAVPIDAGVPQAFVSDPNVSAALAVTPTTLFWVDRGETITDSIQALSLSEGSATPTTFYTASPDPNAAIEDITTDGTNVYFVQVSTAGGGYTSTVQSIPVGGGQATVLATVGTDDLVLTVAGGYVYFSDGNALQRVTTAGTSVTTLSTGTLTGLYDVELTSSGGSVYWTDANGDIVKLATPGGTPQVLVNGQAAAGSDTVLGTLAANNREVFWSCEDDNGDLLCGTSVAGGGEVRILTALATPTTEIAADDSSVYFLESGGCAPSLSKVAVGGGPAVTIASGFTAGVGDALTTEHAIALDATYVYWVGQGQIFRAPK